MKIKKEGDPQKVVVPIQSIPRGDLFVYDVKLYIRGGTSLGQGIVCTNVETGDQRIFTNHIKVNPVEVGVFKYRLRYK